MKTITRKTTILSIALSALFLVSASFSAFANNEDPKAKQEVIKYVGNLDNLPIYQLSLKNDVSAIYSVTVKDADGNVLHTERVSGKNIVRNYQLDLNPTEEYALSFDVTNVKANTTSSFKVTKLKKLVEEIAVSKL